MFDTIKLKKELNDLRKEYNDLENKYETLKDERIDNLIGFVSNDETCQRQAKKIIQLEAIIKAQKEIIEGFMYEKRINRKRKTTVQK